MVGRAVDDNEIGKRGGGVLEALNDIRRGPHDGGLEVAGSPSQSKRYQSRKWSFS